jgi:segregation and condensation protein A
MMRDTEEMQEAEPVVSEEPTTESEDLFDLGVESVISGDGNVHSLVVDVEGFEGPLDVLLAMARTQKVDLTKISILGLADQYLSFIAEARNMKLELAADYLVMAAWLTYMKSRLLLPVEDEEEGLTGQELAARLAFQLQRLQAMRNVAATLFGRDRLGRDVFARGAPEGIRIVRKSAYESSLYELLKAYSDERVRNIDSDYQIRRPPVLAIEDARRRLEAVLGRISDWSRLDNFLPTGVAAYQLFGVDPETAGAADTGLTRKMRRSAAASTFTAGLELARDGHLEIRQLEPFDPIYIRKRETPIE